MSRLLAIDRNLRRQALERRDKPDYCYSDYENDYVDMPDYDGPWHEDSYYNNNSDRNQLIRKAQSQRLLEEIINATEESLTSEES